MGKSDVKTDTAPEIGSKLAKRFLLIGKNLGLSNGYHSNPTLPTQSSLDTRHETVIETRTASSLQECNEDENGYNESCPLREEHEFKLGSYSSRDSVFAEEEEEEVDEKGEMMEQEEEDELPERFRGEQSKERVDGDAGDDINKALLWLKGQVTRMRAQDQSLVRQFSQLRSTLVELRHSERLPNLASLAMSCQSLPSARCPSLSITSCHSLDLADFTKDWSPASDRDVFADLPTASSPSGTPSSDKDVLRDFKMAAGPPASAAKLSRAVWKKQRNENLPGTWYV